MDLPYLNRYTCIHLTRKRYRCKGCESTFFHPLDWIDDTHRATKRFVNRIADLALEINFSIIAREYGISEHAVRTIFYGRYKDIIDTTRFESPDYLGIDELKIAGRARGVITNLSENSAIEFLSDNSNSTLSEYFKQMPNRENIKAVAMDCTRRYKNLVHEFFPQAAVVSDKFHIVRMANIAVDETRKMVRSGIDSKRMKLRLKKDHWTLKTREDNLDDWQKEKLDSWRSDFPLIGVTYDLKEEFYNIYESGSRQEAKERFNIWRSHIPSELASHWKELLTCWGNWENEILNFFDVNEQSGKKLTNAYTECQNGLTRAIDRSGRGYSFEAIRVKLLLGPKKQGVVTSYRSIRKKLKPKPAGGAIGYFTSYNGDDEDDYETEQVQDRRMVTWGVDISKLDEWMEELETKQRRLPGVG